MDWETIVVFLVSTLHFTTTGDIFPQNTMDLWTAQQLGEGQQLLIFHDSEMFANRKQIFSGDMLPAFSPAGSAFPKLTDLEPI